MNTVTVQIRERAKGDVSIPMALWAILMALTLFMLEARLGSRSLFWTIGISSTALFGAYLGLRRRTAAAFIAPLISWMVAWLPLVAAAMIHDGFLKGLVVGIFLTTIGWIGIGLLEFLWLFVVASFFRMLRGSTGAREPDVIVFGPDGERRF
jgi:hypothetical protein